MRAKELTAVWVLTLCLGACRTAEPPVLEISRPALASLGGERAICDTLVSALAHRDRRKLIATMDSLPRTPGIQRDLERGADFFLGNLDRFHISADIVDIRPIGHGVIEGKSAYY